jgi:hypothetical protein
MARRTQQEEKWSREKIEEQLIESEQMSKRRRGNLGYIPKDWIEEMKRRGKQRSIGKEEVERDIQRINIAILETGQKLLREDVKQAIQEAKEVGVNMRALSRDGTKDPSRDPSEDPLDKG